MAKKNRRQRILRRAARKSSGFPPVYPDKVLAWVNSRETDILDKFNQGAPSPNDLLCLVHPGSFLAQEFRNISKARGEDPNGLHDMAWIAPEVILTIMEKGIASGAFSQVPQDIHMLRTPPQEGRWLVVFHAGGIGVVTISGKPASDDEEPTIHRLSTAFETEDGEVEYGLTPMNILQLFWHMSERELADMGNSMRPKVVRFRERVRAEIVARELLGQAPDIDAVLRKVGRPEVLERAINNACGIMDVGGRTTSGDVFNRAATDTVFDQMLLGTGLC